MIEFTEHELNALPVPEYSFACFLASLAGRMLIGYQHIAARECTERKRSPRLSSLPIYKWMRRCPNCARLLKRIHPEEPMHCLGCGWVWDGEEEEEQSVKKKRR